VEPVNTQPLELSETTVCFFTQGVLALVKGLNIFWRDLVQKIGTGSSFKIKFASVDIWHIIEILKLPPK
jgi:hypothetical protein